MFIASLLSLLFAFLPATLLAMHTYYMCTNQTSWESMSRQKVPYIKDLPAAVLPFDQGIVRNIRLFCCPLPPGHVWAPTNIVEPSSNPCYAPDYFC